MKDNKAKKQVQEDKIVINQMPVILRPIDRNTKTIGDWWTSFKNAEQVTYANRTRLYDTYATVVIDGHLSGLMEKRIAAVLNKNIYFERDDKKIDELDELVDCSKFRELIRNLMLQKFWGLAGFEFIPGKKFDFNLIPIKHIKPSVGMITAEQSDHFGFQYEGVWNIWVVGDRYDFGLLLKCTPYVIWKKANMGDWSQYIEIFGQPVIITKYDAHDEKTRLDLDTMMREAGGSLRLQIPTQANFEMHDGKTSNANGDLQDKFRNACNDEMSVIVLGVTETTGASKSSGFAQSQTHAKQQLEIVKSDLIDIINLLNSDQFLNILKSYGYPVDGGKFRFEKVADPVEEMLSLQVDQAFNKVAPLGDDYFYEKYNRPKPANYKELKVAPPVPPVPGQNPAPNNPAKPNDPNNPDQTQATIWETFKAWASDFFSEARY